MRNFEIFLSYCWADQEIAEKIKVALEKNKMINLHMDKIDIGIWNSIKEYMQSIPQMDYTILLISDAYLKSSNCMYEVLEVMRDRNYREKIFPAVINSGIYKPAIRAEYVKYWQNEYDKLNESLKGIHIQNIGGLGEDLKRAQDISANMATFLDKVADMNNPAIEDISAVIKAKLKEKNFISSDSTAQINRTSSSKLFDSLGISHQIRKTEASDLEINQFMSKSFQKINDIMSNLCVELEKQSPYFHIVIEKNDSRNYFYQFYKEGRSIRNLRVFLDQSCGTMNIGISTAFHSFGSGVKSWNGMYTAKDVDGNLYLSAQLSFSNGQRNMTAEDVVKDIWENYINPYLKN